MVGEERRERWEARAEPWLLVGALAFLLAFAWPVVDPDLSPAARTACWVVSAVTWVGFVVDFAVRVALSRRRLHFVLHSPLDLVVVLVPMLRPLALLRVITLIGVLNRHAERALRGRVVLYAVGASALLILVSALVVLQAERGRPGAVIDGFGDALWWAVTTVTTVGYGDTYPTTGSGRAVAAVLMFCGIALIGVVTATVAAWLVDRVSEAEQLEQASRQDVADLAAEVRALRTELAEVRRRMDGDTPGA